MKSTLLALAVSGAIAEQSGVEIQCFGNRAHKVTYSHSDEDYPENQSVLVERDASEDAQCASNDPASDDRRFCVGVNVDESCQDPAATLPIIDGFTCSDCFGGANTDLYYKFETQNLALKTVEVGLRNTQIKGALELTTAIDVAKDLKEGTMDLIDRTFNANFMAGKIPVNLTVSMPTQFVYSLGAEGNLHALAGADLDMDFGEHFISWDPTNGWQMQNSVPAVTTTPKLDVQSAEAGATLHTALNGMLKFEANDMLWYHVNVNPTFPGALTYLHADQQICLNADLDLPVSHEADLHHKVFGHYVTLKHFGPAEITHVEEPGFVHKCVNTPVMTVV